MRTLTIGDPAFLGQHRTPPPIASTVAVWWAADLALADGDPVGSWVARVGAATLTNSGTARPTLDLDGVGGRPGVDFDGTNDYLTVASTLTTSTQGCVVAVVDNDDPSDAGAVGRIIWASADTSSVTRLIFGGTTGAAATIQFAQRNNDATSTTINGSGTALTTDPQALEWSTDGSTNTMLVDNNAQTLTTTQGTINGDWFGDTSARDNFTLGAMTRSSTQFFFNGRIAYLGVFNAPLSSGDRAALYGWISSHYGIAVA